MVSVPVLSTISVSTDAMRSSASASLISTPACAPRPAAVVIEIGVASPSAQGQAMISTDTAEAMAKTSAGSGPKIIQTTKAKIATATTVGTNTAETRSASPWIGARDRRAFDTMATICASTVSEPTFAASITSEPFLLIVAPVTVSPRALLDRHRLAGQHAFIQRRSDPRSPSRQPAPHRRDAPAAGRLP